MGPEIEGDYLNHTVKDHLRGIGDVISRSFKYTPRLVKYVLVGAVIGMGMLGLAFLSEQSAPPDPQIPQLYYYDPVRRSAVNRMFLDNALPVVAGFATLAVIFGCAAPWLDRKLEEFIKPPE